MKKPYTPPSHFSERARLILKKRAEYKLGRPLTVTEEAELFAEQKDAELNALKVERLKRESSRSRASKWAGGGR